MENRLTMGSKLSVLNYLDYKDFLRDVYLERKKSLTRYSFYQFSEDLGFGKTNNSHLIINGKRKLTKLNRDRVVQALLLSGKERKYFIFLVYFVNLANGSKKSAALEKLSLIKNGQYEGIRERNNLIFLNHWVNSVVFELVGTGPKEGVDQEWVERRLRVKVSSKKIAKSLILLNEMNLIQKVSGTDRYVKTTENMDFGSEVQGLGVFRYHQKMIELGLEALEKISYEQRDISALTISVPAEMIPQIKRKINMFRNELAELSHRVTTEGDCGKKDVLQLNIQMFPLSK